MYSYFVQRGSISMIRLLFLVLTCWSWLFFFFFHFKKLQLKVAPSPRRCGGLFLPSAEPSWCASRQGAWRAAWLCQCGRGCVGVVAPLCRISTPVPHPPPLSTTHHLHHHFHVWAHTPPNTHARARTPTITDTTYCLPPTGVNLPTVGTPPKKTKFTESQLSPGRAWLFCFFCVRKREKHF